MFGLDIAAIIRVALLALTLVVLAWLHHDGYTRGEQKVQSAWDAQKVKDKQEADNELQSSRDASYSLASQSLEEKKQLEKQYARLSTLYASSLHQKVTCPASGEVGDVVLPANLIVGMFVHGGAAAASSPGSTSARVDATVR
jgi:hypothetical protein